MYSHWVITTPEHDYEVKIPQAEAQRIATAIGRGSTLQKYKNSMVFSTLRGGVWRIDVGQKGELGAWVLGIPQPELIKMLLDCGPLPSTPTNSTPGVWTT